MRPTHYWTVTFLVLTMACLLAIGPGCSTTKNVMHKATFGLVGGDDGQAEAKQRKQAEKEERERQKAEEKQAKKDAQAAKEQEDQEAKEADGKRGFWSKATFGLVGGDSGEKAAKKEAKRQAKEEKKAQERAREEQKRAEKQARKQEKTAQKKSDEESKAAKAEEPKAKRSLMSKATFGLVGGSSEDKAAKKDAKRQVKDEKKAQERAREEQKRAEKQARKQEKAAQKQADEGSKAATAEEPKAKRSLMSKATFGLVGGDSEEKAAKKEAKRQAKEEKKARERAEEEQEEAEKQARKQEQAAQEAEQPEQKRGLMSKLTFGLVGGKGKDEAAETAETTVGQEMPVSTPEAPVTMPGGDGQFDVQPATAMDSEARKLAKLPFETAVSFDSVSAAGKPQAVVSRQTYSKHGYGITDLGDVRIAVRGMTFSGGTRGGQIVVSSEDRAKASGRAGIGNETFNFEYEKGATTCTFGTVQFTISKGVMTIGGKSIPMGQGPKLVVLDEQGNVTGAYAIG